MRHILFYLSRNKMESEICPQCKDVVEATSKRIIKDSCGHEKCRVCLLQDVDCCRQCVENDMKRGVEENILLEKSDCPNENNHATVITCSKLLQTILIEEQDRKDSGEDDRKNKEDSGKIKLKPSQKRRYEMITMPSHINTEGSPPVFFCTICKAKFKTKGHVKYHKFCLGESKPHICGVCSKSFILKSQLNVHELIHTGKKPYNCKLCEKAFRESGKLKRHMALHSYDKPHVCDECGKNFKTLSSLRNHRIIHSGEKPFSCKYCKMKFNNSSNLKKHLLAHSEDKTHMCEQCGKKFKQKWALTVHCRSHMLKRDFVCKICNKTFVNNKDLKRHETVHLDVKIYSCGICSMSFRRKDNLGRHLRNAHTDKEPQIIKKEVEHRETVRSTVADNPNAINVITSFPMTTKNTDINNGTTRTCMNGPLKLAFKTSAFKKNYNINRDHPYESNNTNEVVKNIEQTSTKPVTKVAPPLIFPSVYATQGFNVDEYYANRPHIIKNIKFKIPTNYPPENEGVLKAIMHPFHRQEQKKDLKERVENHNGSYNVTDKNKGEILIDGVATKAATSVIVNSSNKRKILP